MTDSVDIVEASRNKRQLETTIQGWLDSNSVTSVDDIETLRRGQNKVLVFIFYTA